MRILRFISVLWFCGFSACSQSQSVQSENSIWIDVRTEEEFKEQNIKGAYNIADTEITDQISELTADHNAPIHLFFRSGVRVHKVKTALQNLGYTNVTNEGGFIAAKAKLLSDSR